MLTSRTVCALKMGSRTWAGHPIHSSAYDSGRSPELSCRPQELRPRAWLRERVLRQEDVLTGRLEYQQREGPEDLLRTEGAMPPAAHGNPAVQLQGSEVAR